MAKATYVHFSANDPEFGIQFEADDGAMGTIDGRAFADVDPTLKDAVFKAAQAALDALTGQLPVDLPPSMVTTALMKARNARQEAEVADRKRVEAEIARNAAADEAEQTRKAIAAEQAKYDAEADARANKLAELDKQLAAKRAEMAAIGTKSVVQPSGGGPT